MQTVQISDQIFQSPASTSSRSNSSRKERQGKEFGSHFDRAGQAAQSYAQDKRRADRSAKEADSKGNEAAEQDAASEMRGRDSKDENDFADSSDQGDVAFSAKPLPGEPGQATPGNPDNLQPEHIEGNPLSDPSEQTIKIRVPDTVAVTALHHGPGALPQEPSQGKDFGKTTQALAIENAKGGGASALPSAEAGSKMPRTQRADGAMTDPAMPAQKAETVGLPGSTAMGSAPDENPNGDLAKTPDPLRGLAADHSAQQSDSGATRRDVGHPVQVTAFSASDQTQASKMNASAISAEIADVATHAAGLSGGGDQAAPALDMAQTESFLATLSDLSLQTGASRSIESLVARPEVARMAAAQAAEAMINAHGNKVEISLNPEELGRVRMVLSTSDTGVVISITADRPETLDMMRRHIDQLAKEFRDLGYEGIGFEFSGGDAQDNLDNSPTGSIRTNPPDAEDQQNITEPGPLPPADATLSRGLDLRV